MKHLRTVDADLILAREAADHTSAYWLHSGQVICATVDDEGEIDVYLMDASEAVEDARSEMQADGINIAQVSDEWNALMRRFRHPPLQVSPDEDDALWEERVGPCVVCDYDVMAYAGSDVRCGAGWAHDQDCLGRHASQCAECQEARA